MTIAKKIEKTLEKSSWIRKMFEQGTKLKARYGDTNVFDFSIGNPNLYPPKEFQTALEQVAAQQENWIHGYMANTGYPFVRQAIAENIRQEQAADLTKEDIIITCGAAGGLNVIFKALLNPDDEVLVTRPFFVEYNFYAENHGGVLKTVSAKEDFTIDLQAIEKAITKKTKIMLINSPNNPTGQVYSRESLEKLGKLLKEKGKEYNNIIYLVSDEPYRKIIFDDTHVPPTFPWYKNSIIATSHSKDLSLPGERIGYIAVNPTAEYHDKLINAMAFTNRTLGFVNAPALMQRILPFIQGAKVNINKYQQKRDVFCKGLKDIGYNFTKPCGAFYIFPKSPIKDDVKFVQALQEEMILAVPGSGFGQPQYFRLAFCVEDETIEKSMPGFKKVYDKITS